MNARIAFILAPLLLLLTVHPSPFASEALAERPNDEYRRIQKDLRSQKKKLESVKKVEQSVLEELKKTAAELSEIEKQLARQRDKIKRIHASMVVLQENIKADSTALKSNKDRLRKRLRALLMFNTEKDSLLILLSGEDISQSFRVVRYLRDIAAHDYTLITSYKEELRVLAEKEAGLQRLSVELKSEEKKTAKLEDDLKDKKKERETILVSVRKEKGVYENMIKELKEASGRLLSIIQESERGKKEEKKKKSARTRPGTKPGAKEEEPQEDSEFLRAKGRLSWPVQGTVGIQYGTQVDPLFNLPVFRSGIHIKAAGGSPVRAVHEGKVVFADDFKGYGRLVIISHGGGYHTLYGNLAKIFSKNGAIIKENQTLGEAGESSTLGTSGLYFEIRYRGKPLDPQQWLRR